MAWASRSGRARVSSSNPEAFGVCMRCGFWYQRRELRNQVEWMGATMLPTWVFVCQRCYDTPQEQNRAFIPPADPVPIQLALPEDFSVATSTMGLQTDGSVDPTTDIPVSPNVAMQTVDGVTMAPTPTGRPPGYAALANEPVVTRPVVMATVSGTYVTQSDDETMMAQQEGLSATSGDMQLVGAGDGDAIPPGEPVPVISMVADGTPLVRCTTNGPHGFTLNSQIAVRGALSALADGAFSVIPLTATAFTYGCYSPVPAGSLLTPTTMVVATQIGLPRDFPALPQTGLPQTPVSSGVQ